MLRSTIFFAIVLIACQTGFAQEAENWKLRKDKYGVQVYTRSIEDSRFKEYSAEAEISSSPEKLLELVLDVKNYPRWISHIKSAKYLDEDKEIIYSIARLPFPFKDRDIITDLTVTRSDNNIEVLIEGTPAHLPRKDGVVRIPYAKGKWLFTDLGNGRTKVKYQLLSDPGGRMPSTVVNAFIVDGPYKTLLNMKNML